MMWVFRSCWLLLPALSGPAIADAFSDRSRGVQVVCSGLAWLVWGVVLSASLLPRTVTLTVVRSLVPAAVVLSVFSAIDASRPVWAIVGLGAAFIAAGAAFQASVGDAFADGSSYGDERRVLLRVPPALLIGPVTVGWLLTATALAGGVVSLATEQWIPGSALTALGGLAAWQFGIRLHVLSRRWLVFVPAGLVVHDPLAIGEPMLLTRALIDRFGPADAKPDALDLTSGALGLVLELRSREPIDILVVRGRQTALLHNVDAVLVAPSRPGVALTLAQERRLPVG